MTEDDTEGLSHLVHDIYAMLQQCRCNVSVAATLMQRCLKDTLSLDYVENTNIFKVHDSFTFDTIFFKDSSCHECYNAILAPRL